MNQSLSFDIVGMSCGDCVGNVQDALRKLMGVSDIEVSLKPGGVTLIADPGQVSPAQIESAIAEIGYSAKLQSATHDGILLR